jgi:hypothetical protein
MGLQIQLPATRKATSCRRRLDPCRLALAVCGHETGRLHLQPWQGVMMKPRPDLGLPETVEAFDGRLEPRLPRRDEDGDYSQTQAGPRHPADGIRVDLCALEDGIVVELGVPRQAHGAPVLAQAFHGNWCGDDRVGPRGDQPAEQRDSRENLDRDAR